ncbi:S-layer homology domain-containing protein [Acetivibrio mesophilus]|uniref:S-layer homology domain-containing protein n=1 Tax=Acetivibrio mesophilus TaxID=2487273 RepID=A0A4Q0I104_9FIRM|nr:S-layer homology domain-containing protein [Acetivibrio mesophilus]
MTQPPTEVPAAGGEHAAYLRGYPDGSFKPERNITRAEAAVIFAKLLGANESDAAEYTISYTDLSDTHWAAWAIKYASDKGLFKGYPDGSFKPDQNITRAEFATVVLEFLKIVKDQEIIDKLAALDISVPKFDDSIGHWAQESIERLSRMGYISGYPNGTFQPQSFIKRSESVALINRALERGPLNEAPKTFPDVDESYWAFRDIAEGALDHKFIIKEDNIEVFLQIIEK